MLIILSPSKQIERYPNDIKLEYSLPEFIGQAKTIIEELQSWTIDDIAHHMKVSDKLARLNFDRIFNWTENVSLDNACYGIQAFNGDAYRGLVAREFNSEEIISSNQRLRILSGLYGVVKPLDLIMPYRLEMGVKHPFDGKKNLYEFWGDVINKAINKAVKESPGDKVLVNLASNEYANSVGLDKLSHRVVTPVFKQEVEGKLKIVAIHAKRARGLMTRFVIQNELNEVEHLKAFDMEGYYYNEGLSTKNEWVFTR